MAVIILEPGAPGKNLTTQAVYTIFRFRLKIRVENTDHRFLAGFARGDRNSLWIGSEKHCGESATPVDGKGESWANRKRPAAAGFSFVADVGTKGEL